MFVVVDFGWYVFDVVNIGKDIVVFYKYVVNDFEVEVIILYEKCKIFLFF